MAKRTSEQRLRAAGVRPRYIEDEVALRRDAVREARNAQVTLGHHFGRCGRAQTIRSRVR